MAIVVAVSWFPRTHINLFETYISLSKVGLKVRDVSYGGKNLFSSVEGLSLTIDGYKDYPPITFSQGWSGLHYFTVELPDEGVAAKADSFMKDMQVLLLEKILKVCHTVTYKNIVNDMMSLDFHTLVLTKGSVDTSGYTVAEARDLEVAFKPQDMYYGGDISYVIGSDDPALVKVLLYHAYTEVGFDFIYNMMKAMIRLFHSADAIISDVEASKDMKELKDNLAAMESIVAECASRSGKMKHVILNFRLKEEEFLNINLEPQEKALVDALGIRDSFRRLRSDGEYMGILWGDIMAEKLENIRSSLDLRLRLREKDKKGWF